MAICNVKNGRYCIGTGCLLNKYVALLKIIKIKVEKRGEKGIFARIFALLRNIICIYMQCDVVAKSKM